MRSFAEQVVTGEVTRAVRDTTSDAGAVRAGDWIGLSRQGICSVAPSLEEALTALAVSLGSEDHELLTVLEGEGSSAAVTQHLVAQVHERFPAINVDVHAGGQPLYPYLLGFE